MSLLILGEDELRQSIDLLEAIESIENAFAALAKGQINRPASFQLALPNRQDRIEAKATYLEDAPYYVLKAVSEFPNNPTINLPARHEITTIFDAATGFPAAILTDSDYLTQVRTGAAGAIAAKYLANETIRQVAVIGSGKQAYIQLKMLMLVKQVEAVSIWGRSPAHLFDYAQRVLEEYNVALQIASSAEEAVRSADLVVTATASETPLIQAEWLKPGVHITAVGANAPNKQELHPDVFKRADVIVADKLTRCKEVGELLHAIRSGAITDEQIAGELGDLIIRKISGRTQTDQITVADLTGRNVQDSAIAILALEKALFLGLGHRLN